VFTNWPQPALFTDTAGRITHWNEQAAAVFGWPAAQAVNQDWAELLFAGEAQSKFQALCQAMLSSSARRQIQLLTRCGTGREKACDWTLLPCLGGDGQLEGFFACATPIATPFVAALNA
ncbi:MAG TPA: PAS domain-containing protein, partial [Verrucomicrobiae bacterium]